MPKRPILFLDTSVCVDVARDTIAPSQWASAWDRISHDYRYRISPLTAYELIAGLATGDAARFDENREALRVLFPPSRKKVLPDLRVFVAKSLFSEDLVPNPATPDIKLWLRTALKAPTKQALQTGNIRVGVASRPLGLDLQNINQQLRKHEDGFVKRFREFQRLQVPELTRDVWADLILKSYAKETTPTNRALVLHKLDAAYRFDLSIWNHAKDPKYNLLKHRTDLVDAQQLYYLCNPEVHFLTTDARLRNRVLNSTQSGRIMTLNSFLASP